MKDACLEIADEDIGRPQTIKLVVVQSDAKKEQHSKYIYQFEHLNWARNAPCHCLFLANIAY